MSEEFRVLEFKPLGLTVEDVGPFRGEPFYLDFTDKDHNPCNIFLLMSENGRGKTTLLELMAAMMRMLKLKMTTDLTGLYIDKTWLCFEDIDNGIGKAKWDFYLKIQHEKQVKSAIFSLIVGHDTPWDLPENVPKSVQYQCSIEAFKLTKSGTESLVNDSRIDTGNIKKSSKYTAGKLSKAIHAYEGTAIEKPEDTANTLPKLLYFPAYRDIPKVSPSEQVIKMPNNWRYHPVQKFGRETDTWEDSLDNLLAWLNWLDDGRFEQALHTINNYIFTESNKFLKGVNKITLKAEINNNGHIHQLDRLSSGEKNLLQFYLRTIFHMTRNTILLIDELDVHLHPKWQHKFLNLLKQMAKDHPGLTIIATSHTRELIPAFAHDIPEEGLRKGGHIIEEGLN